MASIMDEHDTAARAIAVVGVGAILPDAPDVHRFWTNVREGRYSIGDVTPDRWDPARYFDPDPHAPDKTYSKIGGWVRDAPWDPLAWRLPIPPKVAAAMDVGQQWAVACTREALLDYGWPTRPLDAERTAVILGNAMAGERHYYTALRIFRPEVEAALARTAHFASLPADARAAIETELAAAFTKDLPEITEDTMPGELANCIAGRIANLFDFHGPNYVVDAACASAMAAMSAAIEGLVEGDFDAVVTGGIDRNMGVNAYVKFSKIGALSATGTRPYADGADGFVMGEGAALFLLKRLADAERAGDRIYAVIRGVGGASDGKGKGITAPNPVGQRFAVERAWRNAGLSPATVGLVEGHGTSTKVGDVVEVESLTAVFGGAGLRPGSVALGSVKSNIGHLKGAAGAAGVLKAVLAVHDKVLPPSLHFDAPNPNIDFATCPFAVNTALREWAPPADGVRRAGVSAFGFGGTNFHVVLEEFVPGRLDGRTRVAVPSNLPAAAAKAPLRGALVVGADTPAALRARLEAVQRDAASGRAPAPAAPAEADLRASERIAIDYGDAAELADRAAKAVRALDKDDPAMWKVLRPQGVFRGRGAPPKIAFLYPGQGSQYVGMLGALRAAEPVVAETFAEADRVMTPLLGRSLTSYVHVDAADAGAVAHAEDDLRQTEITQPAVLTVDDALTRLFAAYGITPDMVMGHSLGEYGALVAAGGLPFADALEAVSARGREMTAVSLDDNGWMAAVLAPLHEVERIVRTVGDGAVIANVNSTSQAVIGGPTAAVQRAIELATNSGYTAIQLPVSHAFHTAIVAPASEPLRRVLARLRVEPPRIPVVANVNGAFYPSAPDAREQMLDILAQQVASPVQFVQGLETLYAAGARIFVEVGPKRALSGFVDDVLGPKGDVLALVTNHPKVPDVVGFNQALCGLYAAGLGAGTPAAVAAPAPLPATAVAPAPAPAPVAAPPSPLPHRSGVRRATCRARTPHGRLPREGGSPLERRRCRHGRAGGDQRRVARPARHRARLRRRQPRRHPARQATDRPDPDTLPPRHARQAHHAPGEERRAGRGVRDHRQPGRRHQAGGARRGIRPRRGVRRLGGAARRPRRHHAPRHRRRARRPARRGHPARPALQDHPQRHPPARPLGAAGRAARRHRHRLRLRLPRLRRLRARPQRVAPRSRPARAARAARRTPGSPGPSGQRRRAPRDRPAHRRGAGGNRRRARTSSTGASSSGSSPWAIRSWPS